MNQFIQFPERIKVIRKEESVREIISEFCSDIEREVGVSAESEIIRQKDEQINTLNRVLLTRELEIRTLKATLNWEAHRSQSIKGELDKLRDRVRKFNDSHLFHKIDLY